MPEPTRVEYLTSNCTVERHTYFGGACSYCCESCNYNRHTCHFCGDELRHDSYEFNGQRHYLSDCRPDLIPKYSDGPMV